ncbi:hypothetical protein AABF64_002117 [Acinetobacter baumannii]|uniref:hypothetical protein n=1 Tax=Acinetobacter seifertii TaxID=1530123 RepID=UPI00168BBA18|nr:hypothetical protein [Acinetobacter seifertii]EKW1488035.1 hypothetical protein [Acinetobacter baumannii]QNX28735.1 hypothetical protein IC791_21350 [Acinetobacter seifertii]
MSEQLKPEQAQEEPQKSEPKQTTPVKTKSDDKWLNITKFVMATAFISSLITIPGLYILKQSQTKIGVVDVQALIMEHEKKVTQQLYANQGAYQSSDSAALNSGVVEQQTKQFVQKMEASIDQINKSCGCVLINKAALLTQSGNVSDYTQTVREALEK